MRAGGVGVVMQSPYRIVLTAEDRVVLEGRVRAGTTAQRDVVRALIVLMAADGATNAGIADELGICVDTARKWRARFWRKGIGGLADAPRSGRPATYTPAEVAKAKALACSLPADHGVPLSRWSGADLASEMRADGISVSASTVRRWLAEDAIKPWQHQSWIFRRDPDFEAKATVVLDLYQGFYQGTPLGPGDRVLSIDAKPSIQARERRHHATPPGPGRAMRVEHEYHRRGALALLAALDVHTGQVVADCPPTTGIAPFTSLVDTVMTRPRYRDAERVFVIVDNGSDHRGAAAIKRLADAHPTAIMIHTPVHASWLNQVEIFFSIVQRKVLSPNDFTGTEQLTATLEAFIDRYNRTATPFGWRYTSTDLRRLLARTEPEQTTPTAPITAAT
jgi:transposase